MEPCGKHTMSATLCLCAGAPFMLGSVLAIGNLIHYEAGDLISAMMWLECDWEWEMGKGERMESRSSSVELL